MKKLLICGMAAIGFVASANVIVETPVYRWHGDTITQGSYQATAPDPYTIISTYSAQPGYYMGIDKEWHKKNDISSYPQLSTPNRLHTAIYNMGLDEMVNAVEPDTTLRTGKEWAGVWTRDVSYSILLSMAYMQPEASKISLMKKVDSLGRIIQDTGSGGAWPVSTDREIWCVAAWEVYKVTGDRKWLEYIYPIVKRSLETDRAEVYSDNGLVKGETSFIDWREQSHPRWMQCADIYNSETLSTSVVHAEAWRVLGEMAQILGHKQVAKDAFAQADIIAQAVNSYLWLNDKGYYAMYRYGRDNLIVNPRVETLGESLAIMWNVADAERAKKITESNPTTPFGVEIFYPSIADIPSYHNKGLWPWVAAWWGLANAKAGNEQGVMQAIGSVFRPAALFATNKENFNIENGDIATELNSSNMLWCLSGNIALTHKVLFGIEFEKNGLAFHPFVPEALGADRSLTGFKYRNATLNISISGYGDKIKSFKVNGKEQAPYISAKQAKGVLNINIEMNNEPIAPMQVNETNHAVSPLTPIAWLEGNTLTWNPIEYINHYIVVRDGERIAKVNTTTFGASTPGEYQVIGVSDSGIESFASEPRSTRVELLKQIPGEQTSMKSAEIAYQPQHPVQGYTGDGFVETDKHSAVITLPVEILEPGEYMVSLRYANGNGPVNTENRCAIRTINVDGKEIGIAVMPQRGRANWDDWGWTNSIEVKLDKGVHNIDIQFIPNNENMNIDTNHALIDLVRLVKK